MATCPSSDSILEAAQLIKANGNKIDLFTNGTDIQTVQLGSGEATPVLRNVVRQMLSAASEIEGTDASGKFVIANGSTETRSLASRFADVVNVKDFGAAGDGATDDTAAIQASLEYGLEHKKTVVFPAGTYRMLSPVEITDAEGKLKIEGHGATIFFDGASSQDTSVVNVIKIFGKQKETNVPYPDAVYEGSMVLNDVFSEEVKPGDLIHVETTTLFDTDARTCNHFGFLSRVNRVDDEGIHLSDPVPKDCPADGYATATVVSVSGKTAVLSGLDEERNQARVFAYVNAQSGSHYDEEWNKNRASAYYIVDWDNATKTATFTQTVDTAGTDDDGNVKPALAAGDTLVLATEKRCHVLKPFIPEIKGIEIRMNQVTDSSSPTSMLYRGLFLRWCRDGFIDDVSVSGFPESLIRIENGYKVHVRKSRLFGANRIYEGTKYSADGTGYGVHHAGCSFCEVGGCQIKSCRGGWTSGARNCATYASVVQDNVFTGQEGLSHTGEKLSPEVSPGEEESLKSYAFGAHGCGLSCIYKSNTVINFATGSKDRGENTYFINNTFLGAMRLAVWMNRTKGAAVIGNIFIASKHVGTVENALPSVFCHFQTNHISMQLPFVIKGNYAECSNGFIVFTGSADKHTVKNFTIEDNTYHWNGITLNSSDPYNVSGVKTSYEDKLILDSSVSMGGNSITYGPSLATVNPRGFTGIPYECEPNENSYVEIEKNSYFCKISAMESSVPGKCTLKLKHRLTTSVIDVIGISGLEKYVSGICYSAGYDRNPLTLSYSGDTSKTSNKVYVVSSSNNIDTSKTGVWLCKGDGTGEIDIYNTFTSTVTLMLKVSCVCP